MGMNKVYIILIICAIAVAASWTNERPGISIKVDKTTCQVNDSINLTGQYIGDDRLPHADHVLGFYGYNKGTRNEIGTKRTEANGMYVFEYKPEMAGDWEFMAYNDYSSPRVLVKVKEVAAR